MKSNMKPTINIDATGSNFYLSSSEKDQIFVNSNYYGITKKESTTMAYITEIPINKSNRFFVRNSYGNFNLKNSLNYQHNKINPLERISSAPNIFSTENQDHKNSYSNFKYSSLKNNQSSKNILKTQNFDNFKTVENKKQNYIIPEVETKTLNSNYKNLNNDINNNFKKDEYLSAFSDSSTFGDKSTMNDITKKINQHQLNITKSLMPNLQEQNNYHKNITFKQIDIPINPRTSFQNQPYLKKKIQEIDRKMINPNDFKTLKNIGFGTFGQIFCVKYLRNNKYYALKKETVGDDYPELIQSSIEKTKMLIEFFEKTNSNSVIRIYADKLEKKGKIFTYYTLYEIAEIDWEKEIYIRQKYQNFYSEQEILNILKQLIKCLAELQKNHITHRDVKPSNVLISKGIYKICDFGESRKIICDGIICSRARGTEVYMSPLLFRGLCSRVLLIRHNTYKSDVYSLGICFIFASTLIFECMTYLRNIEDMDKMKQIIFRFVSRRYSKKVINILIDMLQIEENLRLDFIQLEAKYFP